jgi:cytochrome b561
MPKRYHTALVILHWLLALMILAMLIGGTFNMANVPNSDPEKLGTLRVHMTLGVSVGVLMLLRLILRLRTRHPPAATSGIAMADRLAKPAHWVLYALVFAMVGSGVALSVVSGLPDAVFGDAPLPESFADYAPRAAHGLFATLLIAFIALHVLAALYHIVVRRDGLLARMGFGAR